MASNNPTFNKFNASGSAVGYYTRTLFSYNKVEPNDLLSDTSAWFNDEGFDGLGYLTDTYDTYGSYILPGKYWRPGKSIRIKGSYKAYGSFAQGGLIQPPYVDYLHMTFGLNRPGTGDYWVLAQQNNNNSHQFLFQSILTAVELETMVDFQCVITQTDFNSPSSSFFAQGYYQYSRGDDKSAYPGDSPNTFNSYVPIWKYSNNGYMTTGSADYYNLETGIHFNFYINGWDGNEAQSPDIYLANITIEELA